MTFVRSVLSWVIVEKRAAYRANSVFVVGEALRHRRCGSPSNIVHEEE
jgi:hypothetical protein